MTEATPLYSNFYRTALARARAGHQFTVAEFEALADADPPTAREFRRMAEETRSGRDITVEEFARRIRVPEEFAVGVLCAFLGNLVVGLREETIQ